MANSEIFFNYEELANRQFFGKTKLMLSEATSACEKTDLSLDSNRLIGCTALQAFWGFTRATRTAIDDLTRLADSTQVFFNRVGQKIQNDDIDIQNRIMKVK